MTELDWVEVGTKLPAIGELVLGWCPDREDELPLISQHVYKCLVVDSTVTPICDCGRVIEKTISHWQPFPKPPLHFYDKVRIIDEALKND